MNRSRLFIAAALGGAVLVLAGCVQQVERPGTATPTATLPPAGSPVITPESTFTPTVSVEIPEGLFLKIINLPKESVVRTPTIPIRGITTPDALVSVNGTLVDVDGEGRFTSMVTLQEAPNLIEVVASDFQGNKVSSVLTIIYIP